jgi:hypothetical protein
MAKTKVSDDGEETKPAPAPERRQAIAWAEELGHRIQSLTTESARANPSYWKYDPVKALMGWDDRTEMTRAEYEAAVLKHDGIRHG